MSSGVSYRMAVYDRYASVSGLDAYLKSKYDAHAHNLTRHLLGAGDGARVLDIGSGQGELLTLCRDLHIEAEGVDVSAELVEACRSRNLKVSLVTDIATYLRACNNSVSIVTMIDVLEHFTRAEAIDLVRLIRSNVLQAGGKLIIQSPNMQNPFAAANLFCDITHEWAFTESSITQLLKCAGFNRVDVMPCEYPKVGLYRVRRWLRILYYLCLRATLLVDQPNRSRVLTPNLIAVASVQR